MTISDVVMVFAVLAAPVLAVQAQKWIERLRDRREQKLWVFKTLMATRGSALSHEHVQALNMIELEFTDDSDEPVRIAWKEYLDHLNSGPEDGPNLEQDLKIWSAKLPDLLANLLVQMGQSLGYKLDTVQVKKGVYAPRGHAENEMEWGILRRAAMGWFTGRGMVRVALTPETEEGAAQGKELAESVKGLLAGKTQIRIAVSPDKSGGGTQGGPKQLP